MKREKIFLFSDRGRADRAQPKPAGKESGIITAFMIAATRGVLIEIFGGISVCGHTCFKTKFALFFCLLIKSDKIVCPIFRMGSRVPNVKPKGQHISKISNQNRSEIVFFVSHIRSRHAGEIARIAAAQQWLSKQIVHLLF